MDSIISILLTVVLSAIILILIAIIILYRRQVGSICRQLSVRRTEKSHAEISLDHIQGPFKKLQRELNKWIETIDHERSMHAAKEQEWKQLVTNVSHDIRTPITSVSGYFELYKNTEDPVKKAEYEEIIVGRLKNFQSMLEDFYEYSSLASNDKPEEYEKCSVTRIVSETLFLYYKDIEDLLGSPVIEFEEGEVYSYAKPEHLKRAVQNIIKNALTHGSSDLRVSVKEGEKYVTVSFENRTKETLPLDPGRVFDRTYRADTARSTSGAGLGLCIVKELIEEMGGYVNAYTEGVDVFGIEMGLKRI